MVYIIERIFLLTVTASIISKINLHSSNASVVFSDAIQTGDKEDMYLILLSDNSDRRTIGDRVAKYHDWQFMVLLTNLDESKICGGTLITNSLVLTSAWCITQDRSHLPKIFVSYNLHYLRQQDLVCSYGIPIVHPQYACGKHGMISNDIALVKLEGDLPVPSSKLAKLAPEHAHGCSPSLSNLKVASWAISNIVFPSAAGNTEIHFNSKRSLYEIDQKWTNVLHCVTLLGIPPNDASKYICTKTHKSQPSIGQLYGDGGSPLMSNQEQVGVATGPSYRKTLEKCGLSIWTNIGPYLSWINNVVANSQCYVRQYQKDKRVCPVMMDDFDPSYRKIRRYSNIQRRGKAEDESCFSSFFNKLYMLLCRTGASIFDSDCTQSCQAGSYGEKDYRFSYPIDSCFNNSFDPLESMFPNSKLINLFEIQIGITIFFCFLLCFKVCV